MRSLFLTTAALLGILLAAPAQARHSSDLLYQAQQLDQAASYLTDQIRYASGRNKATQRARKLEEATGSLLREVRRSNRPDRIRNKLAKVDRRFSKLRNAINRHHRLRYDDYTRRSLHGLSRELRQMDYQLRNAFRYAYKPDRRYRHDRFRDNFHNRELYGPRHQHGNHAQCRHDLPAGSRVWNRRH